MSRFGVLTTGLCLITILLGTPVRVNAARLTSAPLIAGQISGVPQLVFDTRTQACDALDIPDALPRAFRDFRNQVHLIATHYVARGMVGPTLDAVKHDCRVLYRSPDDPSPEHFRDHNYLMSFFTVDGRRVAALVHSEFHGEMFPDKCPASTVEPPNLYRCLWDTVTFAESTDGGFTFAEPAPPHNLVASLPYPYEPLNHPGPAGYHGPTNILKVGGYYYAMINDWPYKAQKYGPCLLRTATLFDPQSWRAWDGTDFTIRFVNPYLEHGFVPEEHVCTPVMVGIVDSLVIHSATGAYLANQFTPDNRFGPPGVYVSSSSDLIHWSKPSLVARTVDMLSDEGPGKWRYDYFTLLDPTSPDRNFATVSDKPFLYYVRFDLRRGNLIRALMRRQVQLHVDGT
jgi:hypothetical protein